MSLNDRLARLEQALEHLASCQSQIANLHVREPCDQPLTEEELAEQDATRRQRLLLEDTAAMDASIPCSTSVSPL